MNSYDVIEVSKFMGYFDMEDGFKYLTHDFTEGCSVSIAEMQENACNYSCLKVRSIISQVHYSN